MTPEELERAVAWGRQGGRKRMRALTAAQRRALARTAARRRWERASPEERREAGRRAVQARWTRAKHTVESKRGGEERESE
jgi:hypothetical protein